MPWTERGVVTGANMFLRSMGSAVGVAIFGAVANGVIAGSGLGEHSPVAIQAASGAVFVAVVVATVVTIAGALAMPRGHVDDIEHRPAEQPTGDAATTKEPARQPADEDAAAPGA